MPPSVRVEIVGELVVIEPRPPVQHEQRQPVVGTSLDDPQRGVVDGHEPARAGHVPGTPTSRGP